MDRLFDYTANCSIFQNASGSATTLPPPMGRSLGHTGAESAVLP